MSDWPDVRAALKTYLWTTGNAVRSSPAKGVLYGVPERGAKFPLITLPGQVGGGQDRSEAPVDLPLQQLDIFSDGDIAEMMAVESAVRSVLHDIRTPTTVGDVVLYGVEVIGALDAPDEADRPRRALTLSVTARAA